MKKNIILLVTNILATIYAVYLLWIFGGALIKFGMDFDDAIGIYFDAVTKLIGMGSSTAIFLYIVTILLGIHIITFIGGCVLGWISFINNKTNMSKISYKLYLTGTICFPIYLFYGLPITILGYIGYKKASVKC